MVQRWYVRTIGTGKTALFDALWGSSTSRYARALAQRGISDFEMSAVVADWLGMGLEAVFTGWARSRHGCFSLIYGLETP